MKINTKNRSNSYQRKSVKAVMANRLVYEKAKRTYEEQMGIQELPVEVTHVEEEQTEQPLD